MKTCITISLIILSTLCQAQINLVEHFGNLCAFGKSIQISSNEINITGTTCIDVGNNQFALAGFISGYDLMGNLQYYEQVGDTGRGYRAEKILIDSSGNKYLLGTYSFDSVGNPISFGLFIQKRGLGNQILWTKEYQDTLINVNYIVRDAVILKGGQIGMCGTYYVSSPFETDVLFITFDSVGNVIINNRIGMPDVQEEAWSICPYDQNRIALGANRFDPPNDKNWVLMLDYQGNILDEYLSVSNRRVGVWDIVKTKDGGLACASAAIDGDFSSPENKSYVEKLDSNLNQVWDYTIDHFFSSWNLGTSIAEADNGDIIVGGNYASPTNLPGFVGFDVFLQRLSENGDSIWHKGYYYYNKLTYNETHNMYDLAIENDRIFFVGDANDFDTTPPPGQSLWLVSTDSNGVISGIEDQIKSSNEVLVYPNPTKGQIKLSSRSWFADNTKVEIYNLQGHKVLSARVDLEIGLIDVTELPPSMYILRVYSGNQVHSLKFVKE